MSTSENALILFPGALGDFVCFLPTLAGLRARHCGRILLLAKPALLELVAHDDVETASIDRREVADLFVVTAPPAPRTVELFAGFDCAHSWTGFGNAAFAQRVALATGGRVNVYPFRGMRGGEHVTAYYRRCVDLTSAPPAHIARDMQWLADFESRHRLGDRRLFILHSGSGSPQKNWQGFGAVARYWLDHFDDAVISLRGPAEVERPVAIQPGTLSIDGLTLPQVAALLRRSDLYLGNDSGISHLAGVVGASGVVVFGPTDPATWAPQGKALRVVHAPEPCASCGANVLCAHRLPVDTVIRHLRRLHRPSPDSLSNLSKSSAARRHAAGDETPRR